MAILNPAYVQARSKLIQANKSLGIVAPGTLPGQKAAMAVSRQTEPPSTSHISIVDSAGNAVSLTQSIENIFGSRLMAGGFLLNNQLTDFSFLPSENGKPVANAVAPGKRPRSSMSPTMVFETKTGKLRYVLGSPGGARITPYVLKTLLGVLDWNMPLDTAVKAGNIANRNGETELEERRFSPEIAADLRKRGQTVLISNLSSAVNAIEIKPDGQLIGVADPRRGGRAKGE
jgi:gamma-glutamyltranspeptidase/glutathione hydrolase